MPRNGESCQQSERALHEATSVDRLFIREKDFSTRKRSISLAISQNVPLTPALLRLDPMFDPFRNDPRFQKLCEEDRAEIPGLVGLSA
jgi:hypothetical protein